MRQLREDQKEGLRRIGIMLRRWSDHVLAGNEAWYLGGRRELTDDQWKWVCALQYTIPENEAALLRLLVIDA